MKVFLDTNVIASATATRGLCADVLRTVIEFHDLVVSEHLVGEVRRVLKDKFGLSTEIFADVVWLLLQDTIAAESLPLADLQLKDVADVAMVSSAINGAADILITGDKEVLGLKHVGSPSVARTPCGLPRGGMVLAMEGSAQTTPRPSGRGASLKILTPRQFWESERGQPESRRHGSHRP